MCMLGVYCTFSNAYQSYRISTDTRRKVAHLAKSDQSLLVNYERLGTHIRDARKARSITQEMLAEKLNVSVSHIGKIERGERYINLERLAEISIILNVPVEDLIAGCVDCERDLHPLINASIQDSLQVIQALLKGQPQKTIDLVVTLVNDVIRGIE